MSNFKCFEMEDIAYKEWSDHLDLVASSRTNSWLPAYGYHVSQNQELIHGQNETFSADASILGQQQCLFLETIIEETSDDLCSESDKSGPTGWNSDSDADSVIHLPKIQGNVPDIRNEWKAADFECELPKKPKRRFHDRLVLSDDEEPQEVGESTSMSSRSSSLTTFESLEKHCEDVFKTTASADPFGQEVYSDRFKWKLFPSGSLEEVRSGFSSDSDSSGSSDGTLHRSQSSHGSFRSSLTYDSRLRSYRSFDSLNILENPSAIQCSVSELSQSHNALDFEKEKEMRQEFVARDKKLTATTADLSTVTDSYDADFYMAKGMGLSFRKRQDLSSFHYREVRNARRNCEGGSPKEDMTSSFRGRKSYSAEGLKSQLPVVQEDSMDRSDGQHGKSEPCLSAPSKSGQSVENLSEDSGFSDHISIKSRTNLLGFRNSASSIPEDEDSSPLESSSSCYSDCAGSEEGGIAFADGREHSKAVSRTGSGLKISHGKEPEARGCPAGKDDDDADVKYNSSRFETNPFNCAAEAGGAVGLQGNAGELIASVTLAPCGRADASPCGDSATSECGDAVSESAGAGATFRGVDHRRNPHLESCDEMNGKRKLEEKRQMSGRLPVASTPNLLVSDEEYISSVPSAASSLSHVPLKSLDGECEDLRSRFCDLKKNQLGGSQSTRGVHFCPIVSEVSWREVYSEDETSESSSEPSTDEMSNRSLENVCVPEEEEEEDDEDDDDDDDDDEEHAEVEEKSISAAEALLGDARSAAGSESPEAAVAALEAGASSAAAEKSGFDDVPGNVNNASSGNKARIEKKPVPPTRIATPISPDHMHIGDAAPPPDGERITKLSVSEVHLPKEVRVDESLRVTERSRDVSRCKMAPDKKSGKSRFGGFFERFSFRRLSNRMTSGGGGKKHKEKREKKEAAAAAAPAGAEKDLVSGGGASEEIKIIPLHAPGEEEEEEEALRMVLTPSVVSAKPPLPPCPPRMPVVSRKRGTASGAASNEVKDVADSNMPGVGEIDSADAPHPVVAGDGDADGTPPACEKPVAVLLETDLDTHVTVQSAVRRPLAHSNVGNSKKARSLMNLGPGDAALTQGPHRSRAPNHLQTTSHSRSHHGSVAVDDRAKSMEFLLDKENQAAVLDVFEKKIPKYWLGDEERRIYLRYLYRPPENELQKGGSDRVMSEHQLRVQRSLQKLNIPDWYKNSAVAQTPQGFLLKRHGDSGREHQGWPGLGSKTTSLSSLGSSQSASARSPTSHVLSPSPTPHLLSRWSTSRLNSGGTSTSTSPCGSARSSFNYRQPYLGWRSQERLTRPRTPAERLAAGLLPQQKQMLLARGSQGTPNLSEVRTSIKEVTSAIVHYVSGVQETGSKEGLRNYSSPNPSPKWDASPRGSTGRLCWLESSFVGSRPLDQPETPLTLVETPPVKTDGRATQLYLDLKPPMQGGNHLGLQQMNDRGRRQIEEQFEKAFDVRAKPSPGSTTLDDVLDSLLGLPPTSRSPSPGPVSVTSGTASSPGQVRPMLSLPDRQHQRHSCGDIQASVSGLAGTGTGTGRSDVGGDGPVPRRKSEGNYDPGLVHAAQKGGKAEQNQAEGGDASRKEFQLQNPFMDAVVKCRYSKCGKTATVLDAKRTFKTCHNCSHIYCSRECRRAHWERHRRTCLHSRVGALCRQVLATAKDDAEALRQLSLLARRGYLTHGRGVVKTFFSSPELAEKFVSRGFSEMGEPAYVRSADLLPTEMGTDLYGELMKLCKSYNPDTRFVLYVAVCVVSEVPTSGAVKWERQLVSRCCKTRLDKSLVPARADKSAPPPLPPRRSSSDSLNITREMENPETLILTSLPGISGQLPEQKVREISFTNIQRELRQRGVSLRRQFPDVYKKLCVYVEGGSERFIPVTIYPRDSVSGKCFMCIIMPDSEPEKLQLLPRDSSRVQTIDVSIATENT